MTHNGKTIYLVVIDIFPHEQTASKRGTLKPIVITEAFLVRDLLADTWHACKPRIDMPVVTEPEETDVFAPVDSE